MKIENLRAVLHSFWIFNRSYILPGFFFSCVYISGDPKTEFRCPSGFKPAQTSLGKPNPLCEVMEEFQNRNNLEYSCLTSWNLDCQHASTQSFFSLHIFFWQIGLSSFQEHLWRRLERSLFWRKVGSSSDAADRVQTPIHDFWTWDECPTVPER